MSRYDWPRSSRRLSLSWFMGRWSAGDLEIEPGSPGVPVVYSANLAQRIVGSILRREDLHVSLICIHNGSRVIYAVTHGNRELMAAISFCEDAYRTTERLETIELRSRFYSEFSENDQRQMQRYTFDTEITSIPSWATRRRL